MAKRVTIDRSGTRGRTAEVLPTTETEQHVDDGIVCLTGFLDATSKLTVIGGFQYGQRVHLPIRLAMKVESNRIVKLFESS